METLQTKKQIWLDAADLLAETPLPIQYLVDGILPLGTVGDISGPPGDGKSSLVGHLAMSVATKQTMWFGRKIAGGKVAIIGGEKSRREVWIRDLHRTWPKGAARPEPGNLCIYGEQEPLWTWANGTGLWKETDTYSRVFEYLQAMQPVLVILDTIMRVAEGGNQIDNVQQAALGRKIEALGRTLGTTILTVSHSNQSSTKEPLSWRLHYMSRAGGNGLPGILRWCAGVTRLQATDLPLQGLDVTADDLQSRKLIAFGVSKHNEMPTPHWSHNVAALFEIDNTGALFLLKDLVPTTAGKKPAKKGNGKNWGTLKNEYDHEEVNYASAADPLGLM